MVPKAATPDNLQSLLITAGMPDNTQVSVLDTVRQQLGAQLLQSDAVPSLPGCRQRLP